MSQLDHAHRSAATTTSSEAARRRRAVLDLCAPRLDGQRRAASRSCSSEPRPEHSQSILPMFLATASLLAYEVRQGGADETSVRVFNVKTSKTLEDELPSARYSRRQLRARRHQPLLRAQQQAGHAALPARSGHAHRPRHAGLRPRVPRRAARPDRSLWRDITDDGRYLVIDHQPRRSRQARRHRLPRPHQARVALSTSWSGALDSRFAAIYAKGAWYVKTDYKSPKGRILRADPGVDARRLEDDRAGSARCDRRLLDRGRKGLCQPAQGCENRNRRLHARRQARRHNRLRRHRLGLRPSTAEPPTAMAFSVSSPSFSRPRIYRLDTATGKRDVFSQPKVPFDSSQYELKQVFFKSKDGTRVPMFIAGKKGLKQDGTERLLMTGYGGFNLSITPDGIPHTPGGSSRAAGSRCPTCAAAASMASNGTSRACSRKSRTSSTTGSPQPIT